MLSTAIRNDTLYLLVSNEDNFIVETNFVPDFIENNTYWFSRSNAIDILWFIDEKKIIIDSNIEKLKNMFSHHKDTIGSFKYCLNLPDAVPPTKVRPSDSGYDLTLIKLIKIVGDVEFYDTGVSVSPPLGYYFDVVPRSSISKTNYMLANNVGIIDAGYSGNIIIPLRNFGNEKLDLPCRIVQLIPRRIEHFEPILVDNLINTIRGTCGFGSTG